MSFRTYGMITDEEEKDANEKAYALGANTPTHMGGVPAIGGWVNVNTAEETAQIHAHQRTNADVLSNETQKTVEEASETHAGMSALHTEESAEGMTVPNNKPEEEETREVFGPTDQVRRLTPEMSQALVAIKNGNIHSVSEEILQQLDALAESSPGMAAALGLLTSKNWNEFAYQDADGKWKERNERIASYIYQDNYGILGSKLSRYAMRLNDPDFPPELYDDAVGVLLTIVQKAELSAGSDYDNEELAELLPNRYEAYYEAHKDSKDFLVLEDVFDYEDELIELKIERARRFAAENQEEIQANMEVYVAATKRCREGRGTAEDYALVHAFAPELTKEEMYEDESYIELLQEIKTGRSFSDRPYDPENPDEEKEWYDTQALRYIAEKGYDCDLNSIVGMQVKDMLMDFKIGALNQMKETAAKLGYKTIGEYMEKTGVTMETIDEIAQYDLRWFEDHVANEEALRNVKDFVYQGDGSVGTLEILGKGAVTGVSEYFAEGAEAVYTWLESMNVPADAARAKALYTGEYGRFSGERELYNQLMEMCEEGYFPNDEMNGFVKRYLQAGGSPFELGIVPGDFGFVVEVENTLGAPAEEFREWSKESLTEEQARVFNSAAAVAKTGTGIFVEETVGRMIPGIPGYQKMIDKGSDTLMAMGGAARKNLPGYMADDVRSVIKVMNGVWRDDGLAKAFSAVVANGAQAYNDGTSAGFEDNRSLTETGAMGLANATTMMIDSVYGPGKAAIELAVNGMPENQTMGFVAAVANASGEGEKKTNTIKRTMDWTVDKVIEEAEGNIISDLTNKSMQGILGESDGLPKNREPVQEQNEELEEELNKSGVDFEDLGALEQLREVGRKLTRLGL